MQWTLYTKEEEDAGCCKNICIDRMCLEISLFHRRPSPLVGTNRQRWSLNPIRWLRYATYHPYSAGINPGIFRHMSDLSNNTLTITGLTHSQHTGKHYALWGIFLPDVFRMVWAYSDYLTVRTPRTWLTWCIIFAMTIRASKSQEQNPQSLVDPAHAPLYSGKRMGGSHRLAAYSPSSIPKLNFLYFLQFSSQEPLVCF